MAVTAENDYLKSLVRGVWQHIAVLSKKKNGDAGSEMGFRAGMVEWRA